jgi:predicted nucleic acid-binding protein
MMYVDSSSLMKLIVAEAESPSVGQALVSERLVIVSSLTELEVLVQLRARLLSGICRKKQYGDLIALFGEMRGTELFSFMAISGDVFRLATLQHQKAKLHCRSLDRLHLAAMEELGIRRLMTHDFRQAEAAREMGIDVVMPGVR